MKAQAEAAWTRLIIYPKHKGLSPVWHRIAGESTACGVLIGDRGQKGQPPPGAPLCRHCEVLS